MQLSRAPFDTTDAALYPEVGACTACPKRTGNQATLFADVESPDVCTDPNYFGEKKERLWQLRVSRAKEQGQEVMTKKDAKQVFQYGGAVNASSGYVELTAKCDADSGPHLQEAARQERPCRGDRAR